MKSTGKRIQGKITSELLNLLRVRPPTKTKVLQKKTTSTKLNPSTQQVIYKYQDKFKCTLKNFKLQLLINKNIILVQQPIRKLHYHMNQKVSDGIRTHRTSSGKNNMAKLCRSSHKT